MEAEGRITGEIVLVPSANPIGLAQSVLGDHVGRFNLADGINFNRGYPDLMPKVAERIEGKLTGGGRGQCPPDPRGPAGGIEAWEPRQLRPRC